MFVAASCEKEGVYNPKEKISKIYYSDSYTITFDDPAYTAYNQTGSTGKYAKEVWKWDGKLLKSITYYDEDGDFEHSDVFHYNGKRLSEIRSHWDGDWNYSYVFEYKGKFITSIKEYEDYGEGVQKAPVRLYEFMMAIKSHKLS